MPLEYIALFQVSNHENIYRGEEKTPVTSPTTHTHIYECYITSIFDISKSFLIKFNPLIFCLQDGLTSLGSAAKEGHKEVVELLLVAGAYVNIQDKVKKYCKCDTH